MHKLFLALLLLMFSVSVCLADWQYTRWGMSVDQVSEASKGKLKPCSVKVCTGQKTEKSAAKLFGDYSSGEFNFTAFAYFENASNKLTLMQLKLKDPSQFSKLIGALRTRYGEPASESKMTLGQIYVWRDKKDQISVLMIGFDGPKDVTLSYQPRISDSNKGL